MHTNKIKLTVITGFLFVAGIAAAAAANQSGNGPNRGGGWPGGGSLIKLLPEFRPIGGTGNNLQNPDLDVVPGSAEIALAPLNFADDNDTLVEAPNPRTISNVIAGGTGANGQNAQSTEPYASAWMYVFGQFVDHDIDLESTPTDTAAIDITVPDDDPVFTPGTTIAMTRDERDPNTNTIINTVAGDMDLSQLYGSTDAIAASLRNADGTLQSSDNGLALPVVDDQFITGDPRVMENPELTALTILFMREHNYWVGVLKAQHSDWTGDQLYNMAKAITTAEYQNIVYNEYLAVLLGPVLGPYRGYDPTVNAQVTQEFSTAAFRMGHSQVSEDQEGLDNDGNVVFSQSLAQAFFNTPEIDEANGIDPLLRSLNVDYSQLTDVYTVPTLRNLLFAGLVGGDVDEIDLIAIDIRRQYDVGLATLNGTRKAIGLRPYTSFAQLTDDTVLQASFQSLYGSIDNVDLFMGGLAEKHVPGAIVGQTFEVIIASQFHNLRTGDRFFWQNQAFDRQTAAMIGSTTLATLMRRDTDSTNVPDHLFLATTPSTHLKLHIQNAPIDTHGRKGSPFLNNQF
jgi:peroxidase